MITIGLMSGTSLDGVDAVAVDFSESAMRRIGHAHLPFEPDLTEALLALAVGCENEIERAGDASVRLAHAYAEATRRLLRETGLKRDDVAALAAHGQTVRHRPERGFTLQLNHPALLAEETGIAVVADFRSRDVAAGGEGAPLVPAFHAERFRTERPRAVLNVGGIANVTLLPPLESGLPVFGFDTGPGNMLLDGWMRAKAGSPMDADGRTAARGKVLEPVLRTMLLDPYFALPAPKSTGRERFSPAWLAEHLADDVGLEAGAATLTEFTARTAAEALLRAQPETEELLVCGGGALNPTLMRALRRNLPGVAVTDTGAYGLDPMEVEGAAFAWLGWRFLQGLPGNLPDVTRARGPRILGALYPA